VPVFQDGVSREVSAAFVGVALAITAFPMLARIISERGLAGTRYGSLSLASGALDDAGAWIILAFVLAAASGKLHSAVVTVVGAIAFALVLWLFGRRITGWLMTRPMPADLRVLAVIGLLLVSAWYTDEINLYAVFGAFCLGLVMPQAPETDQVITTITPLSNLVFLPLFFTYSGLNTEFGLLNTPSVALFAVGCVVAAVAGKFGACWAAARGRGEPNAVALRIGALMNARGLMQLIALNVGLAAGIVNKRLFTALVVVALVTTLMTTPLLSFLDRRDRRDRPDGPDRPEEGEPAEEVLPVPVTP
jgi:Kef-type K+ transport system membrane component KefB